MKLRVIGAGLLVCLISAPSPAEIYKYKDAKGNWQFTDRPPDEEQAVENLNYEQAPSQHLPEDLATRLEKRFSPNTPIERATLAVVKVESKLGSGSGFFISDNGYLVTNHHVVRPTDYKHWQAQAQKFENVEQALDDAERRLAVKAARLEKMRRELDQYKASISRYSEREKNLANSELSIYQERYDDMRRDYDKADRKLKADKRNFSSKRYDFNSLTNSAKFATTFTIILKSGDKLTARLVKESKAEDLALLKVDGYATPYLEFSERSAQQGMRVYAIGSPLGMKDFVTSGIITGRRNGKIVTDSQILPGNSGGPLVDEEGRVIGVNTQKVFNTDALKAEGFGLTVPVKIVRQQFADQLNQ